VFKILAFLKKKKDLSHEQFKDYYENKHVPLILSLTHTPLVYKRNYLQPGDAFGLPGADIKFDVVTEQVFASREDLQNWLKKLSAPDIAKIVRTDEEQFLDHSHYFAYVIDEQASSTAYPEKNER
jgi:hypothetical protein